MADEGQNNEISIAGELTETGIKASIKSRAVAAWDRLFGASADKKRAPIDAEIAETNAMSAVRVKMIGALGDLGVERLKSDPEFATRAVDAFLPTLFRRQENKDGVLELALEDLRQNPGTDEQAASGPEKLDDAFLNRFERYAEDATDEQVRERWAKVLASEIRKPGTFSGKVLRVIDELDPRTAIKFQGFCANNLDGVIPRELVGELDFITSAQYVADGLLVEPGFGQLRFSMTATDGSGHELWFWHFSRFAIAATKSADVNWGRCVHRDEQGNPSILVYVLTEVGKALASLITDEMRETVDRMANALSRAMPNSEIRKYDLDPVTYQWRWIGTIPPVQQPLG